MARPKLDIHIPGLPQKSYEYRRGDSILIYDDDKNAILIDGGERELFDQMEAYLRKNFTRSDGYAHVTQVITHWHGDHDCALKYALESPHIFVDEIFCPPPEELKLVPRDDGYEEYARAQKHIRQAKELGKKIVHPPAGKKSGHWVGKIRMWMYRQKANPSDYVDYQVNNTSLVTFFPDLSFLAAGDMIDGAFQKVLKKFSTWKIVGHKIDHHGNAEQYATCDMLTEHGAKICYYTDWEPSGIPIGGTKFSRTGAHRAKQYFVTLRPFEDINITADGNGHVTWKQGGKSWTYDIDYGRKEQAAKAIAPPNVTADVKPLIHANTGFKGYNVSSRTEKIQYIVIHYVGAESTAADNVKYFNAADRQASADYFIGHDGEIYEYNPDILNKYSWHCGGPIESSHHPYYGKCKNGNSIGIELCTKKSGSNWAFSDKTVDAAALLVNDLMDRFDIPADRVIRHYDVTGKSCPRVSGWGAVGGSAEWDKFKATLTGSALAVPQIYRVRKSWKDAKSQLGAFSSLENARAMAAKHEGWKVFDSAGNEIQ